MRHKLVIKFHGTASNDNKFRKPFKKRHSIVYHQGTNRINKYLSQAIEARSVDQEKSTHVNLITLCFKDRAKERQYGDEKDRGYLAAMICSLILLCLLTSLQFVILSKLVLCRLQINYQFQMILFT